MRIIAGTFRSRPLKPVGRLRLRPTSDMLRETLFKVLGPHVTNTRFLDLFAGTGAVGLEAASRGAAEVILVENHRGAARLIGENLALLGIEQGVRLMSADALAAIASLERSSAAPFDIVFLDPPYASTADYRLVLEALEKSPLLSGSTLVIAEHQKAFSLPESIGRLRRFRTLRQGDAALSFYRVSS